MRRVNNLQDVNIVVKSLQDRIQQLETKNRDMHGLKLQNAGEATNPSDYVTLSQLPSLTQTLPPVPLQNYEIVFTPPDTSVTDNTIAVYRYIVGRFRVGFPVAVYLYAAGAPTSTMQVDIMWNSNSTNSVETNLLQSPLVLNSGKNGPVVSSLLNKTNTARPLFNYLATIRPKIVLAGGATGVTICVEVLRTQLGNIKNV